jgi:hypothetical protein
MLTDSAREGKFCVIYGSENFVVPLHNSLLEVYLKTKHSTDTPRSGAVPYVPYMDRYTESKPERQRLSR